MKKTILGVSIIFFTNAHVGEANCVHVLIVLINKGAFILYDGPTLPKQRYC